MKIILRHFLFISVCLLSCNYEPEGIVITDIDPPSLAGINLDLNNYLNKEIPLKEKTTFTYSISTNGKKLMMSTVYFNDKPIWSATSSTSSFYLDPANLNNGSYLLRIEAQIEPETGSLADKAGAEVIFIWTERTVLIDNSIPDDPSDEGAVSITSVGNADGTIKISWSRYNKFNFQSYQVTRINEDGILQWNSPLITDPSQTSVNDQYFLGGKSIYYLTLTAAGKIYRSPNVRYEHPLYQTRLYSTIGLNGDLSVKWSSLKLLENNIKGYRLDIKDYGGNEVLSLQTMSAKDTIATTHISGLKFGTILKQELYFIYESGQYSSKIVGGDLVFGNPFTHFLNPPHFDVNTNSYYVLTHPDDHNFYLDKLSSAGIKLDSLDVKSKSVAYAPNIPVAVYANDGKCYKIDLLTMGEIGSIPNLSTVSGVIAISNDLKLIVSTSTDGVKVYSQDGTSLLTIGFTDNPCWISPDGSYVFANGRIFKFNGGVLDPSWVSYPTVWDNHGFSVPLKSISFLPNDPVRAIVSYSDRVILYNMETKSIELTNTNFFGPCNYDTVSKKMGCRGQNTFVILNPSDLSLLNYITVSPNNEYYLLNESILCSGAQIKLSELP